MFYNMLALAQLLVSLKTIVLKNDGTQRKYLKRKISVKLNWKIHNDFNLISNKN